MAKKRKKKETSSIVEELSEKMKILRAMKAFPRGYAKTIAQQLNVSKNAVYQVTSGNSKNIEIMEALVALAKDNREKKLLHQTNILIEQLKKDKGLT